MRELRPRRDEGTTTRGTPLYMAPEVINCDRKIDAKVDVFALSLLLLEIVSGISTDCRFNACAISREARANYHASGKRLALDLPAVSSKYTARAQTR